MNQFDPRKKRVYRELKDDFRLLYLEAVKSKARVESLEARLKVVSEKPPKTLIKYRTKTESFPEHRKRFVGKEIAAKIIDQKIKGSFDTMVSDLSLYALKMSDFCTKNSISLRQLGIMLFASNFRYVRKKDLHEGRGVGSWYSQTIRAMLNNGLIMRVNPEMDKWVYFSIAPAGEKLVRAFKKEVKDIISERDDFKQAEGG